MLRKDWDDLATGQKGDWYFHHDETYVTIRYGDEVMEVVTIPVKGDNAWKWDGNKESPTLSPSILIKGNNGAPDLWHGFLIAGELKEA